MPFNAMLVLSRAIIVKPDTKVSNHFDVLNLFLEGVVGQRESNKSAFQSRSQKASQNFSSRDHAHRLMKEIKVQWSLQIFLRIGSYKGKKSNWPLSLETFVINQYYLSS